jgi:hypothetical protein
LTFTLECISPYDNNKLREAAIEALELQDSAAAKMT